MSRTKWNRAASLLLGLLVGLPCQQASAQDAPKTAPAGAAVQAAPAPAAPAPAPTAPAPAAPAPAMEPVELPPLSGLFTLGAWVGDDFFEGRFDTLLPLTLTPCKQGMLLADLRASLADEGEQELNLGLVLRRYFAPLNAIIGMNVYYDSRWTENDSQFNQLGAGAEVLTKWVDARANLYLPENDKELIGHEEETVLVSQRSRTTYRDYAVENEIHEVATTTRTSTYRTDVTDIYDVPLKGFDAELGVLLPLPMKDLEVRLFGGYYDFETKWNGNVDVDNDVSGFKGRFEARAWNCLFFDAEVFEDDALYGSDYLLSVRLRVPIGPQAFKEAMGGDAYAWRGGGDGPLSVPERLTEMIMRDPRIQVRNEITLTQSVRSESKTTRRNSLLMDDVIFVYGDNLGDPLENGSAEHPFDVVQEGVDESAARVWPNVYVFGASSPYRENVRISDNINLHGEGCALGSGAPPSHGFGTPIIEGQAGASLITPAVVRIKNAEWVRVAGFEITASPFAGGPWTSPYSGGELAPLAGIFAEDVATLTIECNDFRNLVAGAVAFYGPTPLFDVTVRNNTFNNVGLAIGAAFDTAGMLRIEDNRIQDALLGVAVVGYEMSGHADVFISDNSILGKTVDLAGIEPYELFEDFFMDELPLFPADHPESLPIPTLGGIVAVAGPQADMSVTMERNTIMHPALGIAAVALSPNLFGAGLPHSDALTTLNLTVRDNLLVGGGLAAVYDLALGHAGTIAALVTGNYGTWTESQVTDVGDTIRDVLPTELGFDVGLFGIVALSLGDGAEVNAMQISGNEVHDYLLGIGAVAADEGQMRDAYIAGNRLHENLLGIVAGEVMKGDMRRLTIANNTVIGGSLGVLNPLLTELDLNLFSPDPLLLPDLSLLGIGVIGVSGGSIESFRIENNYVSDNLIGIAAAGLYSADAHNGVMVGNGLLDNIISVAALGLFGADMSDLEINANIIQGGGLVSAVENIGLPINLPAGFDPGLVGIAAVALFGSDMSGLEIDNNQVYGQLLGIGFAAAEADMDDSEVKYNLVNGAMIGILGIGVDAEVQDLDIAGNTVQGYGISALASFFDAEAALGGQDAGLLGIGLVGIDGARMDGFEIRDNAIFDETLGIAVAGIGNAMMSGGEISDNLVGGALAGILGLAVDSKMNDLLIEDNTVEGAGLPEVLNLVDALPISIPLLSELELPDWGLAGITVIGANSAMMNDFEISGNSVSRNLANIAVVGFNDALMRDGQIADNTLSDHLLGITVAAFNDALLKGLAIEDNRLFGSGLDTLNPLVASLDPDLAPLQDVGLAGITLLALNGGSLSFANVSDNTINDHLFGVLAVGIGDASVLANLDVVGNVLNNNAFGISLLGFDGADLVSIEIVDNTVNDSLVGILASAARTDSTEARTPMTLYIEDNTIRGSDRLLSDGLLGMVGASMLFTGNPVKLPGFLMGLNELAGKPIDMLVPFPGLDDMIPGGFDPLDPPMLDDLLTDYDLGLLLQGEGLAGVMLHFREGAALTSSAAIDDNLISGMENGIYAVVVDPSNTTVANITATDNDSEDNVIIGEDTTRADYNLTESGSQQDAFVELPTP